MPHDALTFGLAAVGYALLAADAVRRVRGGRSPGPTRLAAAVILAHVACVWAFRFEWSFAAMWRKSIPAFLVFHGALTLILSATLVREPLRTRLVWIAFVVVSAGAVPAPFLYPEIAVLRIPMLAVLAAAIWFGLCPTRAR